MRFVLPSLLAAFALCLSASNVEAGLFGGCGLGCGSACAPACEPVCEPAPVACDPCAPAWGGFGHHHNGLLHKLFHKHSDCGCDAAPACDACAPAPAPACDACDPCAAPRHSHLKDLLARIKARHAARHACCDAEPACGCEAPVAAPAPSCCGQ